MVNHLFRQLLRENRIDLASVRSNDILELLDLLEHHNLFPYFSEYFSGPYLQDPVIQQKLTASREKYNFMHLTMNRESLNLLDRWEKEASGDIILLKGMSLVPDAYDDGYLRPFKDIDILVRDSNCLNFVRFLEKHGYRRKSFFRDRPVSDATYYEEKFSRQISGEKFNYLVELHHAITSPLRYQIPVQELFSRARKYGKYQHVFSLGMEDLLIHLSIHMSQSAFTGELKHLLDIHLLITRHFETIKWEEIVNLAKKHKASTVLYLSFFIARNFFNTDIPRHILKSLKPSEPVHSYLMIFFDGSGTDMNKLNDMRTAQMLLLVPMLDDNFQRMNYLWKRARLGIADLTAHLSEKYLFR
jgi:hypothetical protein